ncbi:phospho-sugar mutase [Kineococcus xinjiangensis]
MADDPDTATRDELAAVLARAEDDDPAALADLADRFSGFLEFGTAGLRGALGAGPRRMNRAVVQRAAAGLGSWLVRTLDGARPRVVVGYDARHGSADFAADSASVLTGAGCEVLLLPRPLPTPVLAFCVRDLDADAGVMVTASHNPPQDNGYKVYLGGRAASEEGRGVQIVPPADAGIAAAIDAVGRLADLPRPDGGWTSLGEEALQRYLDAVTGAVGGTTDGPALRVVATPLHGVGGEVLLEALRRSGFDDVAVVAEQAEPDPDFPTVAFPNPEEPGALDRALALAAERDADLLLAVDPDADRCCVAVPEAGSWRVLTGDELGCLLAECMARPGLLSEEGLPAGAVLACSVVSSQLLQQIAAHHGLPFGPALTGFKWIARVPGLAFGYEEAIGYCVAPHVVRDKDGISTAVLVARAAQALRRDGRGLTDVLDELAERHGLHATGQVSLRVDDLSLVPQAMARLRSTPPTELAGAAVTGTEDLAEGVDGLPPTDGLRFRTAAGARVVVRPSGTEPKLKCYCEVVVPVDGDLPAARARAAEALQALRRDIAAATGLG